MIGPLNLWYCSLRQDFVCTALLNHGDKHIHLHYDHTMPGVEGVLWIDYCTLEFSLLV